MRNNKLSQFTIDELNRVDQDLYFNELWFLRHSIAARRLFVEMQTSVYIMSFYEKGSEMRAMEVEKLDGLAEGLEALCQECISHHPWWYSRFNPNRVITPSWASWIRLAEKFGVDEHPDEWGDETLYKTIEGWYQY